MGVVVAQKSVPSKTMSAEVFSGSVKVAALLIVPDIGVKVTVPAPRFSVKIIHGDDTPVLSVTATGEASFRTRRTPLSPTAVV